MSLQVASVTMVEPAVTQEDDPEKKETENAEETSGKLCCQTIRTRGCGGCILKFLWEGQLPNKTQAEAIENLTSDVPLHKKLLVTHRRLIGLAIPALIVQFFWWGTFIKLNLFHLFLTGYPMCIIMSGGAIVKGMTSEGGGAVVFPIMTLALNMPATLARDFNLMIQAFGLSCATFSILFMRIQIEWSSIIFCSIGGVFGMAFGFHVVDPALSNAQKKMYFVSIWFSFAFALFLLNKNYKRRTFRYIPNMNWWKVVMLLCTGFVGGIFTAFSGNGLDVCSFSVLTLLFRVSEKVATPTSVVLMSVGTIVGFFWRGVMMDERISSTAWEYVAVCIPICTIGAPIGAVLGSHFHRLVLAVWVYASLTIALVAGFLLVKQTPWLAGVSAGLIVIGFGSFLAITYAGRKLLDNIEKSMPDLCRRCSVPVLKTPSISTIHLNINNLEA